MRIEVQIGAGQAEVRACYPYGLPVRAAVAAAVRAVIRDAARAAARQAGPGAGLVAGRTSVCAEREWGALLVRARYPRSLPVTAQPVIDAVHAVLTDALTDTVVRDLGEDRAVEREDRAVERVCTATPAPASRVVPGLPVLDAVAGGGR